MSEEQAKYTAHRNGYCFDCVNCRKHLCDLSQEIYKKAYEGHDLCLSCRPSEKSSPISPEQRKEIQQMIKKVHTRGWIHCPGKDELFECVSLLLSSEQAWREQVKNLNNESFRRGVEVVALEEQLNQAVKSLLAIELRADKSCKSQLSRDELLAEETIIRKIARDYLSPLSPEGGTP